MTAEPARVMKIAGKGTLAPDSIADVTIFDPQAAWTIDAEKSYSKSRNTPFAGWNVTGQVRYTIVNGRIVFDGQVRRPAD